MKLLSSIIVVGAVWGGYQAFSEHQAAHAWREAQLGADVNGFMDVPPADGQTPDTIYVVAAQNCPHEAAQQADRLARALADRGLPVARTNAVGFGQIDRAAVSKLNVVMNAPLPLVFVHGRVASKPELNQVVEEFYRPGTAHGRVNGP